MRLRVTGYALPLLERISRLATLRSFPSLLRTAKRQAHNLWKTGLMRAMHQRLGSRGVSDRRHLH